MLMALHPQVQQRARREIMSVTGGTRLPSYTELDHLEYLMAIMKEVLRFAPVAPLGMSLLDSLNGYLTAISQPFHIRL